MTVNNCEFNKLFVLFYVSDGTKNLKIEFGGQLGIKSNLMRSKKTLRWNNQFSVF